VCQRVGHQPVVLVGGSGILGGGAKWKEVRSFGMCPWREYWDLVSPLSLSLLPGLHEVSSFPSLPAMMFCLTDPNGVK
jgi:hypothetical protein